MRWRRRGRSSQAVAEKPRSEGGYDVVIVGDVEHLYPEGSAHEASEWCECGPFRARDSFRRNTVFLHRDLPPPL